MRHIKTPELLWPALRQYRHNTDNSPNINHPENGFVTGFDYDETVVVVKRLEQQLAELREAVRSGEASDGYHTHNELYEFRKLYNATLFNEWAKSGKYHVHKSLRHHDGDECFGGGWFIVVAQLPAGQITNHYKLDCWDMFRVQETEKALFEYDGHTGADTIDRLKQLLQESDK